MYGNAMKLFKSMDLTEGNLFKKIFVFSIPLFLTMALQYLYSTVDLVTVRFFGGGDTSMSAIAINGSLISLFVTVFEMISIGSNVAIANAKGASDHDKAERLLHTSMIFAVISGLFVGVLGFFLSGTILELMNTNENIIDLAKTYLQIYFLGLPFVMVYNFGSQILRSEGDSSMPFLILIAAAIVNVAFDLLFVSVFHWDVAGVGWATVLSEGVSAFLTFFILFKKKDEYVNLRWKSMRIDSESLREIVKIGLPAGLQGFFFAIPNVFIQSSLYTLYPAGYEGNSLAQAALVAGASASGNIENYVYVLAHSLGDATVSMTAQNYGAGKAENIKKAFWYAQIWNLILCSLSMIVLLALSEQLLGLYIEHGEYYQIALTSGQQRLFIVGLTYILDGVMEIAGASLRGVRRTNYPMVVTLITCSGMRLLFIMTLFTYVESFHTIQWLYSVYPISWVLASIALCVGYFKVVRKVSSKREEEVKAIKAHA